MLNGGDIYCLWNLWVSWNHFRHVHSYMYSLTFSQLPTMLFLWAKNRQLWGTWLEKMCACNTLCHILQEAAIKQFLYLDCLDTVTVGGDKRKKKPILSVVHFASNSPSLCAAIASEKIKHAKTKTFIIHWFSIHITPSNTNPNHFLNYQYICIPSPCLFTFFQDKYL